jgi:hypothetical protein
MSQTTSTPQFVVVQFLVTAAEGQNTVDVLKEKLNAVVAPIGKGTCVDSPIAGFNVIGNVDADQETISSLADQSYKPSYVFNGESDTDHYLVVMEGDISPELNGPYESDAQRVIAAQTYRVDHGDDDGLYRLNVPKGAPVKIGQFAGAEVNGGVFDEFINSVISAMLNGETPIQRLHVHGAKHFTVFVAGDEVVVDDALLTALSECFCSPIVEFTNGPCDYLVPQTLARAAMHQQWSELSKAGHTQVPFEEWFNKNLKGPYKK